MSIVIKHYDAKFKKELNPKVGLIALSTDQTIENDFQNICNNLPVDIFINRIHNKNPLTKENLLKMGDDLASVTKKILPDEKQLFENTNPPNFKVEFFKEQKNLSIFLVEIITLKS